LIEDAVATIYRQVMYTRWEQKAHARRATGVATAEEYAALWTAENDKLYGNSVIFGPLDRWAWISIPHFISYRFYCFSYAFANLVTYALYKEYQQDRQAFPARYIELLSSGGKDRPEALLSIVGLDPYDPNFWQRGFDLVREMLNDFQRQ
jgi:oligoendopeptidase F